MSAERRILVWLAILAAIVLALHVLSEVLLPFVVGAAVAYFLDPAAKRLERRGWSRTLATSVISAAFFLLLGAAIVLLLPVLQAQVVDFATHLPDYIDRGWAFLQGMLMEVQSRLAPEDFNRLRQAVGGHAGSALAWVADLLRGIVSGGLALFNLVSLVFLTPLVTFYLLRDWPKVTAKIGSWLPREDAEAILKVLHEIDTALAGFARGQALVCLTMGVLYAAALSAAGLKFGLLIGLGIGVLTVIPIVGAAIGAVLSVGMAALQFGTWPEILAIVAIFAVGQVFDGNVLSPKLVGDRVGLHPLWIVFALLAGGALFGFLGVLLAVPVASALGVLARHGVRRYLASRFYTGPSDSAGGTTA
jgi:predicted PurR-regulated permease PerM